MSFTHLLAVLRDRLKVLLATTVAVMAMVWVGYAALPTVYTSRAQVLFSVNTTGQASDLNAGSEFISKEMGTIRLLATAPSTLRVAAKAVPGETEQSLATRVVATVPADTSLVEITAQGSSAENSQAVANAVAEAVAASARSLSPDVSAGQPLMRAALREPASAGGESVTPTPFTKVVMASLAGLAAGILAALIAHRLDFRVRRGRDLVGPDIDASSITELVSVRPSDAEAQVPWRNDRAYVSSLSALAARRVGRRGRAKGTLLVITSTEVTPTGPFFAAGLADVLGLSRFTVLLFDAGHRSDIVAQLPSSRSRCEPLIEAPRLSVVTPTEAHFTLVDASHEAAPDLSVVAQIALLDRLTDRFDVVVAVAPPMTESAAVLPLASSAAGLILVVPKGTHKVLVGRCIDQIRRHNVEAFDIVYADSAE